MIDFLNLNLQAVMTTSKFGEYQTHVFFMNNILCLFEFSATAGSAEPI